MKKPVVIVAAVLLLLFAFSILIYPTPYRYLEFERDGIRYIVKENVITGHTQFYAPGTGWVDDRTE
ncbi:hypothetical protein [Paenibacillus sp. DMB5]|uniref:hypothetical protein n=1 Tax=Paenibacillus sp. DMB5 TaxID=1780103 RepID=UPI00076C11F9|nr:hypothetical protein [Paenibacillus sp. DMB5]KUP22425.1 hypothetical protein AWJ19_27810 [Paenibacillus sp. DMB5]